ncbi:hypothetical protein DFH27DRAFT_213574 [Peziza echinospora]|nr:hypothetical protein DFH27DRAFT_213574 [Peziza echinospora]
MSTTPPRATGSASSSTTPKFTPPHPRKAGGGPGKLPLILGISAVAYGAYYYYGQQNEKTLGQKSAEYTNGVLRPTAEETLGKFGSKVDKTVDEGKSRINEATHTLEQKAEHLKQRADEYKKPVLNTIDNADRKIEKEASKVSSGIGSWFGYGSK